MSEGPKVRLVTQEGDGLEVVYIFITIGGYRDC